jgi:contact-dependent growth inhibition (CDI) system CdiI-like immunity protein
MMFDLELLGSPEGEGDRLFIWGRIKLGHFQDEFQVPLYDWAPGDYVAQWLEAAGRLLAGEPAVVFLTHLMHPTAAYHMGWPAWCEGDRVLVQERLFLAEQLGGPFDAERPEVHLGARQEISDEGLRISQWAVSLRDIAAFVERRRRSSVPA